MEEKQKIKEIPTFTDERGPWGMEKEKSKDIPQREQLLDMLDEMVKQFDNLPQGAMLAPITHYDMAAALMLIQAIFKVKE